MKTTLSKMGRSVGVILPEPIIAAAQIRAGDSLDVAVDHGRIVLAPVKRNPREGWEESAADIAAFEGVDHEWLDFPDDFDKSWKW